MHAVVVVAQAYALAAHCSGQLGFGVAMSHMAAVVQVSRRVLPSAWLVVPRRIAKRWTSSAHVGYRVHSRSATTGLSGERGGFYSFLYMPVGFA